MRVAIRVALSSACARTTCVVHLSRRLVDEDTAAVTAGKIRKHARFLSSQVVGTVNKQLDCVCVFVCVCARVCARAFECLLFVSFRLFPFLVVYLLSFPFSFLRSTEITQRERTAQQLAAEKKRCQLYNTIVRSGGFNSKMFTSHEIPPPPPNIFLMLEGGHPRLLVQQPRPAGGAWPGGQVGGGGVYL